MTGSRRALRAALGFALAGALVLSLALSAHAAPRVVLASKTSEGAPADGHSVGGVLSRNGSLEVFDSKADNLPGSIRFTQEVYVRNFDKGTTELVSVNNNGDPADDSVFGVAISANGRFVVLWGRPSNLPGGDGRTSLV